MNVAFFGGSFNPPHVAHVLAASYARQVGFDKVLVVVVASHAFGKSLAPFEHRVRMCELAFAPIEGVEVSRIEHELPQPNYTLHTLRRLQLDHPDWRISLLAGSDVLRELPSWHESAEVVRIAPLFVLERIGLPTPGAPAILPDVSSSEARRRLARSSVDDPSALVGEANQQTHGVSDARWLEQYLPRAVLHYARAHALYSDAG